MSVFRPLLLVLSALPCLAATFGTVVPHTQPLADLVIDEARKRLYVVNTYTSTVEVYDTRFSPPQLTGIKIGTKLTPLSLALSRETPNPRYLYVLLFWARFCLAHFGTVVPCPASGRFASTKLAAPLRYTVQPGGSLRHQRQPATADQHRQDGSHAAFHGHVALGPVSLCDVL